MQRGFLICLLMMSDMYAGDENSVSLIPVPTTPGVFVLNETQVKVAIYAERKIKYLSGIHRAQPFYSYARSHVKKVKPGKQRFIPIHRPDLYLEHHYPNLKHDDGNVTLQVTLCIESCDPRSKIKSTIVIKKKDCLNHNEVVISLPQSCAPKPQSDTVEKT